MVLEELFEGVHVLRIGNKEVAAQFFKSGGVSHDVLQSDGFSVSGRYFEVEIFVYVLVEIELALFGELHDGCPREEFRDRTGTEESSVRRNGSAFLHVGESVALRKNNFAVLDDSDGCARDVFAVQLRRHHAVKKRFQVGARQFGRRRRSCLCFARLGRLGHESWSCLLLRLRRRQIDEYEPAENACQEADHSSYLAHESP